MQKQQVIIPKLPTDTITKANSINDDDDDDDDEKIRSTQGIDIIGGTPYSL